MGILYKRYFGRLRLLRSSDVDENPGSPRASRRSCRIEYANIHDLYKRIYQICLLLLEVEVCFFCSDALVSSRRHIFELVFSGFGRLMQLHMGVVDCFRQLAVYMRNSFSAYRECGCCEVIVVRVCSSSLVFGVYRNSDLSNIFFTYCCRLWLRCNS